jgi:acetyltransferase-like isoleucine patch superfamily enzyme
MSTHGDWPAWLSAAMDRARAAWWRLRGARLGAKTRVGGGCVIRAPGLLSTGARVQIEHAVHIKIAGGQGRLVLGEQTFVGFGTELDVALELRIGKHVLIAPGCFITDHQHRHARGAPIAAQGLDCRAVRIGDDVWLGAHAVVLPGVSIGDGAIVGAGAVVTRDVAAQTIVAGVPARPIGMRT